MIEAIAVEQLLAAAIHWPCAALLHSGDQRDPYGEYDWLFAVGNHSHIQDQADLLAFDRWLESHPEAFRFGVLSYDLRLQLEHLPDQHQQEQLLPDVAFFKADVVVSCKNGVIRWERGSSEQLWGTSAPDALEPQSVSWTFRTGMERKQYLKAFEAVQELLQQGELYEMNLCRPFWSELPNEVAQQTERLFLHMLRTNPAMQSGYFRCGDNVVISSSPERFLQRKGKQLLSEPIKGTAARHSDPKEDHNRKEQLRNNAKERSENVMIVDLVRNDLSRLCKAGSVVVDELFAIRTLAKVHQMVSIVRGQLEAEVPFSKILEATYPMGSMTGAPKVAAMREIDHLEVFRRGWYSGSLGYFSPHNTFDFNVLIRSLAMNRNKGLALVGAGGAITIQSEAEAEFHETELKAISTIEAMGATVS